MMGFCSIVTHMKHLLIRHLVIGMSFIPIPILYPMSSLLLILHFRTKLRMLWALGLFIAKLSLSFSFSLTALVIFFANQPPNTT